MGPFRTLLAGTALALCTAPAAGAHAGAATFGTAEIQKRSGIEAVGEVIFDDILLSPGMQLSPSITTTSTGTANVSVTGDTTVSLAVPEAVDVTLVGSEESMIVLTALDGEQAGVRGLTSLITPGEILSVDIGGEVDVRPEGLAPGEYRGLLVVVAQYN